jgi:hypothetical protein
MRFGKTEKNIVTSRINWTLTWAVSASCAAVALGVWGYFRGGVRRHVPLEVPPIDKSQDRDREQDDARFMSEREAQAHYEELLRVAREHPDTLEAARRLDAQVHNLASMGEYAAPVLEKALMSNRPRGLYEMWIHALETPNVPYWYHYDRSAFGNVPARPVPWLAEMSERLYPDFSPRRRGVLADILWTHSEDPVNMLVRIVEAGGGPLVKGRRTALQALAERGSNSARVRKLLAEAMRDSDPKTRSVAIETAMILDADELASDIGRLVADDDMTVPRLLATGAFFYGIDPPADWESELDTPSRVSHIAVFALQRLTGEDFGFRYVLRDYDRMDTIAQRVRDAGYEVPE